MMKDGVPVLPNELIVMEILTWLPGKQLGRCKCVCKSWRSIIRSTPFQDTYRIRQRGMILYWSEDGATARWLRFFHSPVRQIREPHEEFRPLHELRMDSSRSIAGVTQLVDGVLCVGEYGGRQLTIHNVCTGERMKIPDPVQRIQTTSTFHLGYDPTDRVYKLLRMIFNSRFPFNDSDGSVAAVHIITLRPSSSQSTWRELNLPLLPRGERSSEYRRSPSDGVLCWFWSEQHLLCFDLNREEFQLVEQPEDIRARKLMSFRALTRLMGRLALWVFLPRDDDNTISYYLQEDDLGKEWSLHSVELPAAFKEIGRFVVASGNLSSSGEMLLMNADPVVEDKAVPVYSFGRHWGADGWMDDRLFVGKLPDEHPSLHFNRLDHSWEGSFRTSFGRLSCLFESNNLHLPLDVVLSGCLS